VVALRFFEIEGTVRKALSVIKKRTGGHEISIRELTISSSGISVGPPLTHLRGVLSGTPVTQEKQGQPGKSSRRKARRLDDDD